MARKSKDIVTVVDGVKMTICAYRGPRFNEQTFDVNKSRYTAWHQGVKNYVHGVRGVQGTVQGSVISL